MEDEVFDTTVPCKIYSKKTDVGKEYDVYLSGDINCPSNYTEFLNILFGCDENDKIHLKVNSAGGNLYTSLQIYDAIRASKCVVAGYLSGEACSAATIIFLACDAYYTGEFCSMLIHNGSSGVHGKTTDLINYSNHLDEHLKHIISRIYENFLTEQEIEDLFEKKNELYLLSNEINDRLEYKLSVVNSKNEIELEKQQIISEIGEEIETRVSEERDKIEQSVIQSRSKEYPEIQAWFDNK